MVSSLHLYINVCALISGLLPVKASSISTETFVKSSTVADCLPSTGFLRILTESRSSIECAKNCEQDSVCESFFFKRSSGVCQLHSDIFLDSASFSTERSDQTSYYYPENAIGPPSTTPVLVLGCPFASNSFTQVILQGESFSYRFLETANHFTDATSSCASLGARLVTVKTEEKMNSIIWLITHCGFDAKDVWVDAMRTDNGTWIISNDNSLLPMEKDTFWFFYGISGNIGEDCARFTKGVDFLWADAPCNANYNYFCEI